MGHYDVPATWINGGWGFKVKSTDELMRCLGRIGTFQLGRRYVWRGVADHRWRVQSSLFRRLVTESVGLKKITEDGVRARELALLREARLWGIGKELGSSASDQHLLAVLQHHGAPTRMLDVTSNPMTALWFACRRAAGGRDSAGALMAFDVTGLPTLRTAGHELRPTYGAVADPMGWHWENALSESADDRRPFLVQPSYPDQRMVAQEGLFLTGATPVAPGVDGVDGVPLPPGAAPGKDFLDSVFSPSSRRVGRPGRLPFAVLVIPPSVKQPMLQHLETTYNRNYRQLFPDTAGFVAALRDGQIDLSPSP